MNSKKSVWLFLIRSSSFTSRPKHHMGQNKHQMPPSTQEISDERKVQQTKSAEKKKTAKPICGQCGIMEKCSMGLDKVGLNITKHN